MAGKCEICDRQTDFFEDVEYGDRCIFHCDKSDETKWGSPESEDVKRFWRAIREQIRNDLDIKKEEHDFSNFAFPAIYNDNNFFEADKKFQLTVNFEGAIFFDFVQFENVDFQANVTFEKVNFPLHVSFKNANFYGNANFNSSCFVNNAYSSSFEKIDLTLVLLDGLVTFENASFLGYGNEINFYNTVFNCLVDYTKTKFEGNTSFYYAKFLKSEESSHFFYMAEFYGNVIFDWAYFVGYVEFYKTKFLGKENNVQFYETLFDDTIGFNDVVFDASVGFYKTRLTKTINFVGVTFQDVFFEILQTKQLSLENFTILHKCSIIGEGNLETFAIRHITVKRHAKMTT